MPTLGSSVGPYHIERELGRGGMGVVFLARDTRLDRDVAIKALPEHLLDDPDRMARFQREAKTLAQLNHPNVGGIHGVEEHGGRRYLILEYVEGPTLAERLENGPVPLDEALDIADQIGAGLAAAHDAGIVHRDLKPGNIMLTADERVKILDFGLAKHADAGGAASSAQTVLTHSPTITRPPVHSPTMQGAIMGTAPYMSPEQARGKAIDKRSDIWSFGAVLYEMLTGVSPFHGESATDSIGAILHRDADMGLLPAETPASVRRVIVRCLRRDRAERYQDIGDAVFDLHAESEPEVMRHARWPAPWAMIAGALVIACFGAAVGWMARAPVPTPSTDAPVVRFEIDAPPDHAFEFPGRGFPDLCVTPAGDGVVFAAESGGYYKLFARDLDAVEPRTLEGTRGGISPFFSPDGRWLGYFDDGRMVKMPYTGGPATTIVETTSGCAVWPEPATIYFATRSHIRTVHADGGEPVIVASAGKDVRTSDGSTLVLGFIRIAAVPGAPYLLATVWSGDKIEDYNIVAVSLADGSMRTVMRKASDVRYLEPGYLLFQRDTTLMAAPFDPAKGTVTGEPVAMLDGIRAGRWADTLFASLSPSGTLAYIRGGRGGPGRRLIHVDESGTVTSLMDKTESIVGGPLVSPDGNSVAIVTIRHQAELWAYDIHHKSLTLVNAEGESWVPNWSADSSSIVFNRFMLGSSGKPLRKVVGTNVNEPAETLDFNLSGDVQCLGLTPDGTSILLQHFLPNDEADPEILFSELPTKENPSPTPRKTWLTNEYSIKFSPDGRHIAFCSTESGRGEVYVRSFSDPGSRLQVSFNGGRVPCWSRDGKRVYFLDRSDVMHAVDIDTTGNVRASPPQRLFDTRGIATLSLWGNYDTTPDGGFVMVAPAPWELEEQRITVVVNWIEELRRSFGAPPR